jgi:two-component system response regulator YesN
MKVLLVEDEPMNLEGLKILIDWSQEGFDTILTAQNGQEALDCLKGQSVDLIIADIKMPVMSGIELLRIIREEKISDAYFVIISGFGDFSYAQTAMRYECMDYILKPTPKEQLLRVVRHVSQKVQHHIQKEAEDASRHKALMRQHLAALLSGRYHAHDEEYLRANLAESEEISYIHIVLDDISRLDDMSDDERFALTERMYENCVGYLGEEADHCLKDVAGYQREYEIGLLYQEELAKKRKMDRNSFLNVLLEQAKQGVDLPIVMLVGKSVEGIANISKSYATACALRSFRAFRNKKEIYYYEEDMQVQTTGVVILKDELDRLIQAVEINDKKQIISCVDELYKEMKNQNVTKENEAINLNYLLFQFIHLAISQDESVNQEEVMRYIDENIAATGLVRNSRSYLQRFACDYADYLVMIRKNITKGVLGEIEKEIKEHYAENLTLRDLGKKYFINSSYLGQIFRKNFGASFKDYLNDYRINEAALLLLRTDEKVSTIAGSVGYHDLDYFVSRFIAVKGCTPAKYRKK